MPETKEQDRDERLTPLERKLAEAREPLYAAVCPRCGNCYLEMGEHLFHVHGEGRPGYVAR